MQIIVNPKNPRLPAAPLEYNKLFMDELERILGLYFNTVDNAIGGLINPASGTTANRPTIKLQVGQQYYDTTLGIPIWYNGTVWKNASGTTV
jgi:hypothetical protein